MNLNEAKEILKNNGYTINESTLNYKLLTKKYEVVPIIFDALEKNGVAVIYHIGEFTPAEKIPTNFETMPDGVIKYYHRAFYDLISDLCYEMQFYFKMKDNFKIGDKIYKTNNSDDTYYIISKTPIKY